MAEVRRERTNTLSKDPLVHVGDRPSLNFIKVSIYLLGVAPLRLTDGGARKGLPEDEVAADCCVRGCSVVGAAVC